MVHQSVFWEVLIANRTGLHLGTIVGVTFTSPLTSVNSLRIFTVHLNSFDASKLTKSS